MITLVSCLVFTLKTALWIHLKGNKVKMIQRKIEGFQPTTSVVIGSLVQISPKSK